MTAVAKRESSDSEVFVGSVLHRASPVLTWRPALEARAERERVSKLGTQEVSVCELIEDREASRFSRAPTRKMIAWPIARSVRRDARRERTAVPKALVAAVALAALLLGGAIGVRVWHSHGVVARAAPSPVRVAPAHVLVAERPDSLAPQAPAPTPAVQRPAPSAPAPAHAQKAVPLASHRGRTHQGHRPTARAHRTS
jgi:hypothetical protein